MFEKILILCRENLSKKSVELVDTIKKIMDGNKIEIVGYCNLNKQHLKGKDIVITVGGDGTFVRAVNLIENFFMSRCLTKTLH